MDFLKKAAGKDKKEEHAEQPTQSQAKGENADQGQAKTGQAAQGQGQGQDTKPDYLDKAFDQGAKKAGYNIDPNTREKITDAGREAYEKATGNKVPDKVSN